MKSYTSFLYFLLTFILLHKNSVLAYDPQLYHFCSSTSSNYTTPSPYSTNLNKLLTYLSVKTPTTGFSKYTTGSSQDNTYGLALCRGDVSSSDCKSCVRNATHEIRSLCPNNKGAIVWYDYCLVKYSDQDFFGKIDNQNKFSLYNVMNISNDPMLFNQKTKELLSTLVEKAIGTSKLYAADDMVLDTFTKLYGLVQCTRDLSKDSCKECLNEAISELKSCCDSKQGGRVVGGSCNFRYEIYPFVMDS